MDFKLALIQELIASLIIQDTESALSYAYLHTMAGKAGMSCKIGDRHEKSAHTTSHGKEPYK